MPAKAQNTQASDRMPVISLVVAGYEIVFIGTRQCIIFLTAFLKLHRMTLEPVMILLMVYIGMEA